jgi:hypothetical protein
VTYRAAPVPPDGPVAIAARLEPDAIGVIQDTVIGMASSAPAGTIAALAVALAYGSEPAVGVLPDPAPTHLKGAVMSNAPARPVPARQHGVITRLVCGMTGPSPQSPCLPG